MWDEAVECDRSHRHLEKACKNHIYNVKGSKILVYDLVLCDIVDTSHHLSMALIQTQCFPQVLCLQACHVASIRLF